MGQAKRRKEEIAELKKRGPRVDTTGMSNRWLYHGTTETVARRILDNGEGLLPRAERPSRWQHAPSRSDCVYLTDIYGVKYASDIQINTFMHDINPVRGAVIEVDMNNLNHAHLLADEDYMAKIQMMAQAKQSIREGTKPKEWTLDDFRRLEIYYANNELEGAHLAWRDCLLHYGTVAYSGVIPREAITRIALITIKRLGGLRYGETHDEKLWKIHPNPSAANLTEVQRFQAELTHTVFDTPHPEIEVIPVKELQGGVYESNGYMDYEAMEVKGTRP